MSEGENWDPRCEHWCVPRRRPKHKTQDDGTLFPLSYKPVLKTEKLPIGQAFGRVLVHDVSAALPVPLWDISAVGGVAFDSAFTTQASLKCPIQLEFFDAADQSGESDRNGVVGPQFGTKVRVGNHSRMPASTDAVLPPYSDHYLGSPREQCHQRISVPVAPGTDVVRRARDTQIGRTLAEAGCRLSVTAISALALAGVSSVLVQARPRIAVYSVNGYYQSPAASEESSWMPDAVTPLVLGLLSRWGYAVDTVGRVDDSDSRKSRSDRTIYRDIKELCTSHDITIAVGKFNDSADHILRLASPDRSGGLGGIAHHPDIPGAHEWDRHPPAFRPFEHVSISDLSPAPQAGPATGDETLRSLACLEGLPLSVLVSMYLVVRPVLDSLEGVDRKRTNPIHPYRKQTAEERRFADQLDDPNYKPTPFPQGVRWFNGTLAAPAPRDPDRHWVQLARFDHSQPGRVGLIPLPSEEWRVSSMAEAEAMVAIEKGEGDMPAGSEVQFFLLD